MLLSSLLKKIKKNSKAGESALHYEIKAASLVSESHVVQVH